MTDLEVPEGPEAAAGPETATGQPEPQSPGPVPWEDPERPRWPGFFQTLGEILRRPAAFFARPARGGPAEPFAFGLIMGTAGTLLALFWWVFLLVKAGPEVKSVLAMTGMADLGWGPVALVMALTPLTVLTKLVLGSLCLWGAAALLGVRVEWAGSLEDTVLCHGRHGPGRGAFPGSAPGRAAGAVHHAPGASGGLGNVCRAGLGGPGSLFNPANPGRDGPTGRPPGLGGSAGPAVPGIGPQPGRFFFLIRHRWQNQPSTSPRARLM